MKNGSYWLRLHFSLITLNYTLWWGIATVSQHYCNTVQYSFERMWEWVCWSVTSVCQVLHSMQSFCSAYCSVQYSMTGEHGFYCACHQALYCVNVFVFQFLSATSTSHVLALSNGREGLLWCRDLNWSPQTWEGGLWTNTTPSTHEVVRTKDKCVLLLLALLYLYLEHICFFRKVLPLLTNR